MKNRKLSVKERSIENDLLSGYYVPVKEHEHKAISDAITRRRKDKVLNIRINSTDLESIKAKARKIGVKYQTFIAEVLHKVAL